MRGQLIRPVVLAFVALSLASGCDDWRDAPDISPGAPPAVHIDSLASLELAVGSLEDLSASRGGLLFGLDKRNMQVVALDADGTVLYTMGGQGAGPGEFREPRRLALGDSLLVVGDANSRFSVFKLDGSFRNSFVIPGIRFMNSNLAVVGDSVVAVAGYVEGSDNVLGGRLVHLVTIDGARLADVVPLSQSAMTAESVTTAGASVAVQDDIVWAIQTTEYTLSRVDVETGSEVEPIGLQPDYFRPLADPEPPVPALPDWVRAFDSPSGLYVLSDSVLLVTVSLTSHRPFKHSLDFVDTRLGTVFHSLIRDRKVVGVDTGRQIIFVEGDLAPDEQIEWVERYRYTIGSGGA